VTRSDLSGIGSGIRWRSGHSNYPSDAPAQRFVRRSYKNKARTVLGAAPAGGGLLEESDADWSDSGDDGSDDEDEAKDR